MSKTHLAPRKTTKVVSRSVEKVVNPPVASALPSSKQSSLACLMRRYEEELVPWLISEGFDADIARDAALKAVLKGKQSIDEGWVSLVRDRGPFLRTVAHNAAVSIVRKLNRVRIYDLADHVHPSPLPDAQAVRGEEMACLNAAIGRLPDHLRVLFEFCCVYKHTLAEAARTFCLSAEAVNSLLYRARTKLRVDLRRQGFDIPYMPKKSRK